MSRKYKSPLKWGLSVFALTAGTTMGIGAGIGTITDSEDALWKNKAKEYLETQIGYVEETQRNKVRAEKEIGESCLKLVNIYMPGGKLAGTAEDTAVTDVLQAPGNPCGQTITDVRIAYRSLASVNAAVTKSQADVVSGENSLRLAEEHSNDSGVPEGILYGGLVGTIVGGALGFITAMEIDLNNPPKPRKK